MNREAVVRYIKTEFCVKEEHLWAKFPDYAVFRSKRSKKWFAIVMAVDKSKLSIDGAGKVNIVNLKCGPVMAGTLLQNNGFFPAYHMNKRNWVTVLLDGSVGISELKDLIHLSYEAVDNKNKDL